VTSRSSFEGTLRPSGCFGRRSGYTQGWKSSTLSRQAPGSDGLMALPR